jgi:hypothetical protein
MGDPVNRVNLRRRKMNNITQSVKILGQVVELLLGANFTTPVETVMKEYPNIENLF